MGWNNYFVICKPVVSNVTSNSNVSINLEVLSPQTERVLSSASRIVIMNRGYLNEEK